MKNLFPLKAILLMLVTSLWWCPSAQAAKVEKTIGTIVKGTNVNFYRDNGGSTGYQFYNRAVGIDASACEFDNLKVEFDFYIENLDDPGNISLIDEVTAANVEIGNSNTATISWNTLKQLKKDGTIQAGKWEHLTFEFAKGNKGKTFDLSKTLQWFRIFFHKRKTDADPAEVSQGYRIRLKNVVVKDKSQMVDEDSGQKYTSTDYDAASLDFSFENKVLTSEQPKGWGVYKKFDPAINVSEHNPRQLYLQFDADITEGTKGDINVLKKAAGQIELTSSGMNDKEELTFSLNSPDWKPGKHTYQLPFSTAGKTGGDINYASINYMRFYCVNLPEGIDKLTISVNNVKIVDRTTVTSLPTFFSDGMMFQQQKPVNIWGYADTSHTISVKFYKGEELLAAKDAAFNENDKDETGKTRWDVQFDGQKASFDKYHFVVYEDGKELQTVNDILIGELWVAGGQSNMALKVGGTQQADSIMKAADNDNIRFLWMPVYPNGQTEFSATPYKDIPGAYWGHGNNGTQVGDVSAVAYIAIEKLQKKLGIPVGFFYCPIGGTVIEAWIPRQEIEENKTLVSKLDRLGVYLDEGWWDAANATTVTTLYNQKVGPLAGYNVAGTLWYQGESNSERPELYRDELPLLKKGWERTFNFNTGDMPFVFCQVARWEEHPEKPQWEAQLDESMFDGWKQLSNAAMLPLYDTDMTHDGNVIIHPTNKIPVGTRFANAIYNLVYNDKKDKEYTAPYMTKVEKGDGFLTVTFDRVGAGLKSIDGQKSIKGFAVADERNVYVNAQAEITGTNQVKVWSDGLRQPDRVTYAFATYNFKSTLANSEDIPAAPFRSERDTTNARYYNPQDWTFADGYYWGLKHQANANGERETVTDHLTAWTAQNAYVVYDHAKKQEGTASLKLTYDAAGDVTFGPELPFTPGVGQFDKKDLVSYVSVVPQFAQFNSLSVWVLNNDNRPKSLTLVATLGDGSTQEVGTPVTVKADTEHWQLITFNNGSDTKLPAARTVSFKLSDSAAGSLNIDNVSFNLDKVADDKTVSGIENVSATAKACAFHDLSGRRVAKPVRAGVYICNGRKVVVK